MQSKTYILIILVIVILLRFLHVLQQLTVYSPDREVSVLYQITQIKDNCWYSTDSLYFEIPECYQMSVGETYYLAGSIDGKSDRSIVNKKRLIISEKNEVIQSFYSFNSWNRVFLSWRSQIWRHLSQPILANLPHPHSVVILSMIFGEQEEVGEQTEALFKLTGTSHIQAVSGYNFAVITAGIHQLVVGRVSKRKQGIIILVAALMFFCVVGVQPSVIRAVASLITVITGRFFLMRQAKNVFCLVIVLYFVLFWKPLWLFSISFQLSVAAVVGILFIQPILEHKLESILSQCTQKSAGVRQMPFLITEVVGGFTTAVAASLTTAPLLLCYFHELPLIGIGISAIFASLLNLIVSCGFWTTLTAGLIYNSFLQGIIALWIKLTLYLPLEVFLTSIAYFSHIQLFTITLASFSWWLVLAWYMVLISCCWMTRACYYSRAPQERIFI